MDPYPCPHRLKSCCCQYAKAKDTKESEYTKSLQYVSAAMTILKDGTHQDIQMGNLEVATLYKLFFSWTSGQHDRRREIVSSVVISVFAKSNN